MSTASTLRGRDSLLMAELRAFMRQAAEELDQWDTKSEAAGFDSADVVRWLPRGAQASREFWEARQLEAPAGTQMEA